LLAAYVPDKPREVMGLTFKNPVGLAAGLDKNGEYIDALASLGCCLVPFQRFPDKMRLR